MNVFHIPRFEKKQQKNKTKFLLHNNIKCINNSSIEKNYAVRTEFVKNSDRYHKLWHELTLQDHFSASELWEVAHFDPSLALPAE